jgi:hypothetical protein
VQQFSVASLRFSSASSNKIESNALESKVEIHHIVPMLYVLLYALIDTASSTIFFVEDALAANLDVAAAQQQLREARAATARS